MIYMYYRHIYVYYIVYYICAYINHEIPLGKMKYIASTKIVSFSSYQSERKYFVLLWNTLFDVASIIMWCSSMINLRILLFLVICKLYSSVFHKKQ